MMRIFVFFLCTAFAYGQTCPPTSESHNPAQWHGLLASDGGTFEHTHGDYPLTYFALFGQAGAWAGYEPLGFESFFEPEAHGGYKWFNIVSQEHAYNNGKWVFVSRIQFHLNTQGGLLKQNHGCSVEALICDQEGCGTIRQAGICDCGPLIVDGVNVQGFTSGGSRKFHHWNQEHLRGTGTWYCSMGGPARINLDIQISDGYSAYDPNTGQLVSNCTNGPGTCRFNQSNIGVHGLHFNPDAIPNEEVLFYNDSGALDASCSSVSPGCYPVLYEDNPPLGITQFVGSQSLHYDTKEHAWQDPFDTLCVGGSN